MIRDPAELQILAYLRVHLCSAGRDVHCLGVFELRCGNSSTMCRAWGAVAACGHGGRLRLATGLRVIQRRYAFTRAFLAEIA